MEIYRRWSQGIHRRAESMMGEDPEERDSSLQGLGWRAVLALFVLVFHSINYAWNRPDVSYEYRLLHPDQFWQGISLGTVGGFFAITGFHLYRRWLRAAFADEGVDIRRYFRRRIARILPLYYMVLLVTIPIVRGGTWMDGMRWPSSDMLWPHFLFLQQYFPQTAQTLTIVGWAVCVDVAFYLLMPLVGWVTLRLGHRLGWQWAWLGVLAALSLLWRFVMCDPPYIAFYAPPFWLIFLVVGMVGALIWESHRLQKGRVVQLGPWVTAGMLAAGFGLAGLDNHFNQPLEKLPTQFLLLVPGCLAVGAAIFYGTGPAVRWLRSAPLLILGVLSYGIFLWHLPITLLFRRLDWLTDFNAWETTFVVGLLTLLVAGITFWLVEMPALRWGHRRRRGSSDAPE